jgi:hypothetical protein
MGQFDLVAFVLAVMLGWLAADLTTAIRVRNKDTEDRE